MSNIQPKFQIGDTVYNTIERKGSYEPSICRAFSKLKIDKVERTPNGFRYTCEYDGYEFNDHELISEKEYIRMITMQPARLD